MYTSTNPFTGNVTISRSSDTDEEILASIAMANNAYKSWRKTPLPERLNLLAKVASIYRERMPELATVIAEEMGKPYGQAEGEVQLVAAIYDYYAKNSEKFLEDEILEVETGSAITTLEPIGAILGIMPWNFPYYQVARFAAPNLALGNSILLKHAPNCVRSAEIISDIFADAGLPSGVYVNIEASHEQVEWMLADERVKGVSVTGSERAGSAVGEAAGRNLKPVVMELGGNDPFIVLDSKDMDSVAAMAAGSRLFNSGQACVAAKRFIVLEQVYDEFITKFEAAMKGASPGDPMDPSSSYGPLVGTAAAKAVEAQIAQAIQQGAKLVTGGRRYGDAGTFIEPTILTDLDNRMDVAGEEIFGPVASVYRARSVEEAIEMANDSPYGLGASVFTEDEARAEEVARQLEVGMVWINSIVGTQPDLPFGGTKRSGMGRELSHHGISAFANRKLIRK